MNINKKIISLLAVLIIASMLFVGAGPVTAAPKETIRVWVEFQSGKKNNVESFLSGKGAHFHYLFEDLNSYVVSMPVSALNGVINNPNVVDVEEDMKRYPMAQETATLAAALSDTVDASGQIVPWGIDAVQARDVWDIDRNGVVDDGAPTGAGRKVCIIDTGYYMGHEDLPANVNGFSQVDNNWAEDGVGHGSHVAGTIAAMNNGVGVVGVTPGTVDLFIVKIFDNDGTWTNASDLAAAANTCVANEANIISMSLGGGYSRKEERAFNKIYDQGVLSIAAAGNDGNTAYSFPASYSSVMSVAALDESLAIAEFSQQNDAVEIAAPGVAVLSTVPYLETNIVEVDGVSYESAHIEYAAYTSATGEVVDGGFCLTTGDWAGKVVMCSRGENYFIDKVMNVQNSGGVAALIYNNLPNEMLYATLGEGASSTIVAQGMTMEDGLEIVNYKTGTMATVSADYVYPASAYENYGGTSMATPHVSAVAALVWSADSSWTNVEIREALTASALDLGASGKDDAFGYGLVQAAAALDYLGGGTPPVNDHPSVSIDSPASGSTFTEGDVISFNGSASDTEDGDLSDSINWSSDLDSDLGTGASISVILSVGTHTITATVMDSEGASDSDSITVTVNEAGSSGALVVSVATDSAIYTNRQRVYVTTTVTDDGSVPVAVAGATVSSTITTVNNTTVTYSGVTNSDGTYTYYYRLNTRKVGTGIFSVESIASMTGYEEGTGSTTFTVQ